MLQQVVLIGVSTTAFDKNVRY